MKVNFRQGVVSYQTGGFLQIIGNDVSLLATNRSVTITVAHKDTDYTHSEDKSVNNAWAGPFIEPKYWLYWNFDPLTFARTFGTTTLEPVAQSVAPGTGDTAITGVVAGTGSPITSAFIIDGSYSLSIGKPFAVIGSTANDGNYTVSSISIGGSPLQTTIYVNEPVNSVVVDGSVTLDVDSDGNPLKVEGRHWYDTSIGVHYVLNGSVWQSVLRVFAAQLLNGNTFISVNQEANTGNFSGTQIGNNTAVFSGRILFDESSDPIRRDDGTFFTTEDQFFTNQSRVDALRLESNVTRAQCIGAALSAFSVVAWTNDGQVNAAQYDDVGSTVVGLLTENLTNLEVGGIIVQGTVTNPAWNWTAGGNPVAVGSSLWVENGLLTATDPNLNDPITYPIARVPVARVLDKDTIIFEQGLGGVGVQGPQGLPADLIAADTTDLGSVTLLTASSDSARAFVISDTDSRLTDARTPLTHTHQAADVTFQPGGGLASTDVQDAVVELGTDKLNLSGGSLTGFLTLNADPTALAHAASKQYVDNNIIAATIHIADTTIHFTEASIDHTNILSIGTNTHAQIDTHIADVTTHFIEANIDHVNILNIGTNTHTQIDTHIADATTHFIEANIDHTNISNIGTNTHTQIDTHIADAAIHSSTLDGLSDVNTAGSPAPADGQVLTWNNSSGYWENAYGGPSIQVESVTLSDGQTSVTFTNEVSPASFYITGNLADNGRLEEGVDYTVDAGTKTLTLTQSYPAGTKLIMSYGTEAGSTNLGDIVLFDTVAQMNAASTSTGLLAQTKGYYTASDGGAASYYIKSSGDYGGSPDEYGDHTLANGNVAVLQIDNIINVKQYGATGDGTTDDTSSIQAVIDYTALTVGNTIGATIFYPRGEYIVSAITLKSLISHVGEGARATIIKAKSGGGTYLFKLDVGPVQKIRIENMQLEGVNTVGQMCFLFEAIASAGSPFHGGLWDSSFANLNIINFDSHAIWLKGGETGFLLPNQFNVFRGVQINRADNSTARNLLMTGQVAQHVFIDCRLDGQAVGTGTNIELSRQFTNGGTVGGADVGGAADGDNAPTLNRFITCTSQSSDFAFKIDRAQDNYIDGCWFENLEHAIDITTSSSGTHISNNRFANAGTDGSSTGYCVKVGSNSSASVLGNTIAGTYDDFLVGSSHIGIRSEGNNAQSTADAKTSGVVVQLGTPTAGTIITKRLTDVAVNSTTTPIDTIDSWLVLGDIIRIRTISATTNYLIFTNADNISTPGAVDLIVRTGNSITIKRADLGSNKWVVESTAIARLESTAKPAANYYIKGEFVWNTNPVQSVGKVLIGWSRLVTGTTHVLDTDWSACYVTTT